MQAQSNASSLGARACSSYLSSGLASGFSVSNPHSSNSGLDELCKVNFGGLGGTSQLSYAHATFPPSADPSNTSFPSTFPSLTPLPVDFD
jgi:hypothetical protein